MAQVSQQNEQCNPALPRDYSVLHDTFQEAWAQYSLKGPTPFL